MLRLHDSAAPALRGLVCGVIAGLTVTIVDGRYLIQQVVQTPWVWVDALRALTVSLALLSGVGGFLGTLLGIVIALERAGGTNDALDAGSHRRRWATVLSAGLALAGLGVSVAVTCRALLLDPSPARSIVFSSAVTLAFGPIWYVAFRLFESVFSRAFHRHGLRIGLGLGCAALAIGWSTSVRWDGTPVPVVLASLTYVVAFGAVWLRFHRWPRILINVGLGTAVLSIALLLAAPIPPQAMTLVKLSPGIGARILRRVPLPRHRAETADLRTAIEARFLRSARHRGGLPMPGDRLGHENQPDIVLLTIDALRADRLTYMGRRKGLTPHLDGLALESLAFANAMSNAPFTVGALSQLLTGRREDDLPLMAGGNGKSFVLSPEIATLPMLLRSHGYRTFGFFTKRLMSHYPTAGVGFEEAEESEDEDDEWVVQRLVAAVNGPREGPLFLWGHMMGLHEPRAAASKSLGVAAQYDECVRQVDARVGQVLGALRRSPRWNQTVVVVTADHGESLGERGLEAHGRLVPAELKIPLILHLPATTPAVLAELVSHMDIVPTLMPLAGAPKQTRSPGRNLLEVAPGSEAALSHAVFHELAPVLREFGVTWRSWQLTYDQRLDAVGLVNLADDPDGLRNLSGTGLPLERELLGRLANHLKHRQHSPQSDAAHPRGTSDAAFAQQDLAGNPSK